MHISQIVKSLLLRLDETPENFTRMIIFMSMSNDISKDQETIKNASPMLDSFFYMQRDFEQDNGHCFVFVQREKWCFISTDSPQGEWDRMAEKKMLEFGESGHPIFLAISPLSRGRLKNKGHGKLSMHCCADWETIETIFRINVSVNQLSLYGAIAALSEEYETHHDRTGQPVVRGQWSSSFVPNLNKTEVSLDCDNRARKDLQLQHHGARIEKLSQQDRLSKFCVADSIS